MTDLKIIMRIARTDLAILFYSPIAWFILIVFSFLTTASFTSLMENIVTDYDLSGGKEVSLSGICFLGSYGFLSSVVSNIYIYIPLLTMGLISRETASGSIKLAYSSPVTSGQIVLGKYLAAIGFGCCLMLVPIASAIYGSLVIPSFDWAPVLVALLGLYLLICAYRALYVLTHDLSSSSSSWDSYYISYTEFRRKYRPGIRSYTRTDLLAVNKRKNNRYAEWSNPE